MARPASVLQAVKGARFYLSKGAAGLLEERKTENLVKEVAQGSPLQESIDTVVMDLSLKEKKRLLELNNSDFLTHPRAAELLKLGIAVPEMVKGVFTRLVHKLERGVQVAKGKRILHTAPHHDDIMLSYYGAMRDLMPINDNYFVYVTSGFHSVTNGYMLEVLSRATSTFLDKYQGMIFNSSHHEVISAFVQAHKEKSREKELEIETVLGLRNVIQIWDVQSVEALTEQVTWLNSFFVKQQPGDKSPGKVQILKGAMRETEADRLWGLLGVPPSTVHHLRSAFYTDDFFTPLPTIEDDAVPMVKLLDQFNPDIVTVAFDPEGTGPDTHYKVLQVVAQALRMQEGCEPLVWGYRNVWFRFHMAESTAMIPVDDEGLIDMNDAFLTCFSTQKAASFPAPDYDGPFSEWSELSQRSQRQELGILLGEDYFFNHADSKIRASTGYIFLKEMSKSSFINGAQELKWRIEV